MKKRSIKTAAIVLISTALIAASFSCSFAAETTFHDSADDAAAELREAMKQRSGSVKVGLKGSTDEEGLKKAIGALLDRAVEHTGVPDEGDYLNFQFATYNGSAHTTHAGLSPAVEFNYWLTYYDSREQEDEVDRMVAAILEKLDLEDRSDHEKVAAIHDYICDNVEYEAAEGSDNIRRTAYGALVDGKAVCQGYSLALYRLLLEAGIDNRIIFGEGVDSFGTRGPHTWNIVELNGEYYYVDATWDDSTRSRDYFLKPAGAGFEESHIASGEYAEDFFTEQYPMATEEFKGDISGAVTRVAAVARKFTEAIIKLQTAA